MCTYYICIYVYLLYRIGSQVTCTGKIISHVGTINTPSVKQNEIIIQNQGLTSQKDHLKHQRLTSQKDHLKHQRLTSQKDHLKH